MADPMIRIARNQVLLPFDFSHRQLKGDAAISHIQVSLVHSLTNQDSCPIKLPDQFSKVWRSFVYS